MSEGKEIVKAESNVPSAATPYKIRRSSRHARHLAQHVLLEESGTSRLVRMALLLTSGVTLAFVIWAAMTRMQETAVAVGQVVPSDQVQVVQHLEGGIISDILVEEGQLVDKGQVMLIFDGASADAEYEQTLARQMSLRLRAERLRAIGAGREPEFDQIVPGDIYMDLKADQQSIYDSQIEAYNARRAILERQLRQRYDEISQIQGQRKSTQAQAELIGEQVGMRQELLDKGLVSRVVFLETKREHTRLMGEAERLRDEESTARERLAETEKRLVDVDTSFREMSMNEMGTVTSELAQVTETLTRLSDRVNRLEVRSPARGLIQNMQYKTVGAVVPAGGIVTEVVPMNDELMVEVQITTRDIGHVMVGLPVTVKFITYDFSRYGSMSGRLVRISPTTFMDEASRPYYKGIVSLDRNYLGETKGKYPILPGMTCQADIVTGEKTLLEYLLKPIYNALDQAFHER